MTCPICPLTRRSRLGVAALGLAALTATASPGTASAAPTAVSTAAPTSAAAASPAAVSAEQAVAGLLSAAKERTASAGRLPVAAAVVGTSLPAGGTLAPGDSLRSPSGRYELLMDPNGQLLLQTTPNAYQPQPDFIDVLAPGEPGSRLVLQADGNLVLYGPANPVYFDTATTTGQRLDVQDDGNVVLYGAGNAVAFDFETAERDTLYRGGTLLAGERLTSEDRNTSLVMQTDGNLVLSTGGVAQFATNTFSPGAVLVVQEDGNAVVYSRSLQPLFSTGTRASTEDDALFLAVGNRQFNVFAVRIDTITSLYGSAWGTSTVESGALLLPGDRRTAPGGRV